MVGVKKPAPEGDGPRAQHLPRDGERQGKRDGKRAGNRPGHGRYTVAPVPRLRSPALTRVLIIGGR